MRAAILAVGTEITSGQIANTNAAWLSQRLQALGAHVTAHLTVPDDRPLIREALDLCARHGELIFVTGGLGPTTDDFTREVIAEWAGAPLEFHPPSWEQIENRLGRLGIPVAPSNKQQCYFPTKAEVIPNHEGTANAFSLELTRPEGARTLWALPGPPREIDFVWNSAVQEQVFRKLPRGKRTELKLWQLMGKSEAEVGEITEAALAGAGLQIGYRAHRPFIEVKVWVPEDRTQAVAPALAQLDAALAPWVVARGVPDFAGDLLKELEREDDAVFIDHLTHGILGEKLFAASRDRRVRARESGLLVHASTLPHSSDQATEDAVRSELDASDSEMLTLAAAGFAPDGTWCLGLRVGDRTRVERFQTPYRNSELIDRSRRYAAELALLRWRDWLRSSTN